MNDESSTYEVFVRNTKRRRTRWLSQMQRDLKIFVRKPKNCTDTASNREELDALIEKATVKFRL